MAMRIVETTEDLRVLAGEMAGASYLALDTEFMRDQTYWPKLCLIQIATPGIEAIIDPLAEGDRSHAVLRPAQAPPVS